MLRLSSTQTQMIDPAAVRHKKISYVKNIFDDKRSIRCAARECRMSIILQSQRNCTIINSGGVQVAVTWGTRNLRSSDHKPK